MNNISENSILSVNRVVSIVKKQDNGALIFNPDTTTEKFINATGLKMLEVLIPGSTVLDASKKLAKIFEMVDERQILADLIGFYDELKDLGFIIEGVGNESLYDSRPFPNIGDAPQVVDVAITGNCNLKCPFCFYSDDMRERKDISLQEWLTFFNELHHAGVRNIVLSGGEVFLRKDIWELLDGVVNIGLRFSLLSNGTLINEDVVKRLDKSRYRNRLNSIQISIDGSCPEVHDLIRGTGSFHKSVEALRLLIKSGLPVTVRVTVNRFNIQDLEKITELLLVSLNLPGFTVNDALPIGAACGLNEDITISTQQQYDAMKRLAGIQKMYGSRVQASAGPLALWHCFQEMEEARMLQKPQSGMGYLSSCGCASIKLAVHHDGNIAPCNMLTGLTIGKINKDSFSDIWRHHPVLKELRDRRKIPITESPGCSDCEWSDFCKGGCPVTVYHETGDFKRANPHDCYRLFLKANKGSKPWLEDNRAG